MSARRLVAAVLGLVVGYAIATAALRTPRPERKARGISCSLSWW